jgi:ferritin-like metal-binding protein YciE
LSIAKAVELFGENISRELIRVGLLEVFQQMAHYKISGYGIAVRYAGNLGLEAISQELQLSLEQEQGADLMLGQMVEERLRALP